VHGDSLSGIGIYNGDTLICESKFDQFELKPQDVVICKIVKTNEFGDKLISVHDETVTLFAAHPDY
jgi:SOS-response transcriptional repressor LexA